MTTHERRARFRALHERDELFVMPNPWDIGSARLLEVEGFEALATTSQGFAWALGKQDRTVTRDELVAHVAELAASTPLPLNVDSERCYPDDPGGIAETVSLLAEAGAAGFSIEDYDPATNGMDPIDVATARVSQATTAVAGFVEPLVVTARAENHIRGVDDLDDTIARLVAYRDAGADVVYAPGLVDLEQIAAGGGCGRCAGQRPRAAGRADDPGARLGRRAPRVHGEPAHERRLRSARLGARELLGELRLRDERTAVANVLTAGTIAAGPRETWPSAPQGVRLTAVRIRPGRA